MIRFGGSLPFRGGATVTSGQAILSRRFLPWLLGDAEVSYGIMKTILRSILLLAALFAATAVFAVPTVNITVKQTAGGQTVKQVKTDSAGNFWLGSLPAGQYTLEFRSPRSPQLKNMEFFIAIDGTKKTGTQGGISGGSLVGGVAVNVEVGPSAHVTGQIAVGPDAAQRKQMVYVPPLLGSHMPGKWVEKGSAEAVLPRNQGQIRTEDIRKWQDHGDVSH
jgi:hypothetical protein